MSDSLSGGTTIGGYLAWHKGNMGTGSGLDADLLDAHQGSYYLDFTNMTNKPDPTITLGGDLSGSVTLTDLGNGTLTATVADDSHNHTNSTITGVEASTPSTVVQRNDSGDINARLFRSEYDTSNPTINYFMTQIDTADNNFIRPSTIAQAKTSLGIDELFTSVSNGKSSVASAITDKGVTTASDATFATLASNISAIGNFITGTVAGTAGVKTITCGFEPKFVMIWSESQHGGTAFGVNTPEVIGYATEYHPILSYNYPQGDTNGDGYLTTADVHTTNYGPWELHQYYPGSYKGYYFYGHSNSGAYITSQITYTTTGFSFNPTSFYMDKITHLSTTLRWIAMEALPGVA